MSELKENIVLEKSIDFSVRIVKFHLEMIKRNKSIESISNQLLRSGTSIGANISEAQSAESKKDFIHKLSISLKETRESIYWITIFTRAGLISTEESTSLKNDCLELLKLLITIINKSKK